jgi:hypothetical protein
MDAIFFIPHANPRQHRGVLYFFFFYVQTCQFFCWLLHLQHAVICCLVNGVVIALNSQGTVIWKVTFFPVPCCCFCSQSKYICIVDWEKTSYWSHIYQLYHIELIWPYITWLRWERGKKLFTLILPHFIWFSFTLILPHFIRFLCVVQSQHIYLFPKS